MAHGLQICLFPNLPSKQADWNMYAEMKIRGKINFMGLQSYNNSPIKEDYQKKKKSKASLEITFLENITKENQKHERKNEVKVNR